MSKVDPAVDWLKQTQAKSGAFPGLASARPDDFRMHVFHPTVFFTALILNCLQNVPEATGIQANASRYLLKHRSKEWTWNYWERGSEFTRSRPYPDDLDDTACALAGLLNYQPDRLSGAAQAHVARALIATEQKPGGPYNTWLIDATKYPLWRDTDVAVNANVGYMLSLQKVHLAPLEAYITEQILTGSLTSKYYIGEAPVIYFIARWYRGLGQQMLTQKTIILLRSALSHQNALEIALLCTALQYLGSAPRLVSQALRRLRELKQNDHWPAQALYYEPPVNGTDYYAGSAALTTAFCLETLYFSHNTGATVHSPTPKRSRIESPDLSQQAHLEPVYLAYLEHLLNRDEDRQITNIAGITSTALGVSLSQRRQTLLNSASAHGWMAYTLYDNILDNDEDTDKLPLATTALRHMLHCFYTALPQKSGFHTYVDRTLATIDEANYWEQQFCRISNTAEPLHKEMLPDFADYQKLADRSWGHTLAPAAVLLNQGVALDDARQEAQRGFFRNYIIARQLVDDAHDWESDLLAGRFTAVNTMLLADYFTESSSCNLQDPQVSAELRLLFWQKTILQVSEKVFGHLQEARTALEACNFEDTTVHEMWLDKLQNATQAALNKRKETRAFLRTIR